MTNYILQAGLFVGLAAIVYVFIKAAPRVGDLPQEKKEPFHWFKNLPLDKLDNSISSFSEKWLRKARIFIMKLDHSIVHKIDKIKKSKQTNEKKEEIFRPIPEENDKTEQRRNEN